MFYWVVLIDVGCDAANVNNPGYVFPLASALNRYFELLEKVCTPPHLVGVFNRGDIAAHLRRPKLPAHQHPAAPPRARVIRPVRRLPYETRQYYHRVEHQTAAAHH